MFLVYEVTVHQLDQRLDGLPGVDSAGFQEKFRPLVRPES
jgi:hypothetical protein